ERREAGRVRREVRATKKRGRGLDEEEASDAAGDRSDTEGTLEHHSEHKLPNLPPMNLGSHTPLQNFWGAHAPSRADFGALAEIFSESEKVRDREGAIASTRGGCAPRR